MPGRSLLKAASKDIPYAAPRVSVPLPRKKTLGPERVFNVTQCLFLVGDVVEFALSEIRKGKSGAANMEILKRKEKTQIFSRPTISDFALYIGASL
jgi:hypothetical protein